MPERLIFHVDVNSAFLSWEAVWRLRQGEPTDLRTIPSIVGGDREKRRQPASSDLLRNSAQLTPQSASPSAAKLLISHFLSIFVLAKIGGCDILYSLKSIIVVNY